MSTSDPYRTRGHLMNECRRGRVRFLFAIYTLIHLHGLLLSTTPGEVIKILAIFNI